MTRPTVDEIREQIRADARAAVAGAPVPTDEQLRRIADVIRPYGRLLERRVAS